MAFVRRRGGSLPIVLSTVILASACGHAALSGPEAPAVSEAERTTGSLASGSGPSEAPPPTLPAVSEPLCGPTGFCWENPVPLGTTLESVAARDRSHVYAAARGGELLVFDGLRWAIPRIEDQALVDVAAAGAEVVHVLGSEGLVLRYDGTSWTRLPRPFGEEDVPLFEMVALAPDRVFVAGLFGRVAEWDGSSWTERAPRSSWPDARLAATSDRVAMASGMTFRWLDDPDAPAERLPIDDPVSRIVLVDRERAFAIGRQGGLAERTASGWTPVAFRETTETPGRAYRDVLVDGEAVFACTGWGEILVRDAGGTHPEGVPWDLGPRHAVERLARLPDGRLLAVGHVLAVRSHEGLWRGRVLPDGGSAHAIAVVGPSEAWAVGRDGLLARFDGTEWSVQTSGIGRAALLAAATLGHEIHAVGTAGAWWVRGAEGTWRAERAPTEETLRSLVVSPDGGLLAASEHGLVRRGPDGAFVRTASWDEPRPPVLVRWNEAVISFRGTSVERLGAEGFEPIARMRASDEITAIVPLSARELLVGTSLGGIERWTGSRFVVERRALPLDEGPALEERAIAAMRVASDGEAFALDLAGHAFHRQRGRWSAVPVLGSRERRPSALVEHEGTMLAIGGDVWRFTGEAFEPLRSGVTDVAAATSGPDGSLFLVGASGTVVRRDPRPVD